MTGRTLQIAVNVPPAWVDRALCAQVGGDAWFPEIGEPVTRAKIICLRCPVRRECLEYALDHRETFGVWGGMSTNERELLAILGAMHILTGIETWLNERIRLDLNPLWHVIPRRFKVSLRWDRPGAVVDFGSGRQGVILSVTEADDADQILLVQPCTAELDENDGDPEWVTVTELSPLPGHSFRETLRAMRGKENESA